jgi:predicted RNA-binding Zn ribbon-like protein
MGEGCMMVKEKDLIEHGTGSGALSLDFANTVDWHSSDHPSETLFGYPDLVEWSRRQGILSSGEARALLDAFGNRGEVGDSVMQDAAKLREAVYRLFANAWHGKPAKREDLEVLNAQLSKGMSAAKVDVEGDSFRWGWKCDERTPDMMLWPIARDAAELLTSDKLPQVKECANEKEGCGWLFLDTSRSGNRVWCSMDSCGNRAKFRTFYDKHKRDGAKKGNRNQRSYPSLRVS